SAPANVTSKGHADEHGRRAFQRQLISKAPNSRAKRERRGGPHVPAPPRQRSPSVLLLRHFGPLISSLDLHASLPTLRSARVYLPAFFGVNRISQSGPSLSSLATSFLSASQT